MRAATKEELKIALFAFQQRYLYSARTGLTSECSNADLVTAVEALYAEVNTDNDRLGIPRHAIPLWVVLHTGGEAHG